MACLVLISAATAVPFIAIAQNGDEILILAAARLQIIMGEADYKVIKTVKGHDLVGLHYQRLFDHLAADGDICRVHAADFVSTDDGTGIVHVAPAYGMDLHPDGRHILVAQMGGPRTYGDQGMIGLYEMPLAK